MKKIKLKCNACETILDIEKCIEEECEHYKPNKRYTYDCTCPACGEFTMFFVIKSKTKARFAMGTSPADIQEKEEDGWIISTWREPVTGRVMLVEKEKL